MHDDGSEGEVLQGSFESCSARCGRPPVKKHFSRKRRRKATQSLTSAWLQDSSQHAKDFWTCIVVLSYFDDP